MNAQNKEASMAQLPHTQTSDAAVKDGHKDISLLFIQHNILKTHSSVSDIL